jgi:hypothetical protein
VPLDPSQPSFVPFCSVIGAFVASALARGRGASRTEVRDDTLDGAFIGTGLGLIAYVIALVTGVQSR